MKFYSLNLITHILHQDLQSKISVYDISQNILSIEKKQEI